MNSSGLWKPFLVIPVALLWIVVFTFSGCDSSSSGTVSTEACTLKQYTEKIYVIGDIEGELADEIEETFLNVVEYDGVSTDAPIFVASGEVPYLSDTFRNGISDTYRNLFPIVVIDGGEEENNALLDILDIEQNYTLPEGILYSELFAVDREEDGHSFTWSMYPPDERPLQSNDVNAPPATSHVDSPTDQCRRALIFRDWIDEDGFRVTSEVNAYRREAANALAEAGEDESGELTKLAKGFVAKRIFSSSGNIYQLNHYVYSCHSFNAPNAANCDWFYVRQECMLSASGGYHVVNWYGDNPWDWIGYYIGSYDMENFMHGMTHQDSWVSLMTANPQNAIGVTQITSGVDWNIGGSVGFSVGTEEGIEGTASLSGGVTIQNSSSVSVSDCEVNNNSGDEFNNAKWSYVFPKRCDQVNYVWYSGLTPPPLLSRSTFQPVNQWIWKFSPEMRESASNDSFISIFKAYLIASEGGDHYLPWVADPPKHYTYGGAPLVFQVPLSYPPLLVVPHNVDFSAAAQYKSMDIAVARGWRAESDQDWCRIEPSSGTGDNPRVNITVDENGTGASRTATVSFFLTVGAESDTMTVFQAQY